MPTQNPIQAVLIQPGMSTAMDARMLPIGKAKRMQNLRMRQGARFEKRPGTATLGTTGLPTAGFGCWLAEHHGAPWAGVEETLSTRRARSVYMRDGSDAWTNMGRHGVVNPLRRFGVVARDENVDLRNMTCVAVGNLIVVAYENNTDSKVIVTVLDQSGTPLRSEDLSSSATPRLVYANSVLYLVYRLTSGGGTSVLVRTLNVTDLSFSAPTTLSATLNSSIDFFDCANLEGTNDWLIAYPDTATAIFVARMAGTTEANTASISTVSPPLHVGIAGQSGQKVCVAFTDGTAVGVTMLSDTLTGAATVGVASLVGISLSSQICPIRTGTSEYAIVWSEFDSSSAPSITFYTLRHVRVSTTPTVTAGPWSTNNVRSASKPFTYGESGARQVLVWAYPEIFSLGATSAHYVLELDPLAAGQTAGAQLAATSYDQTASEGGVDLHLPEIMDFGSGRRATTLRWATVARDIVEGIDVAIWDSARPTESMRAAHRFTRSVNGALHVSGGVLYDVAAAGSSSWYIPENGFAYPPTLDSALAAGGSLTSGTTYTYTALFRHVDDRGRVHRSAAVALENATPSGGNLSVTVRATQLSITGRRMSLVGSPPVAVDFYRQWLGGPSYYVGSVDVTGTAATVTFTDTLSDAGASASHVLYQDLGIVATFPPSGARLICDGGQRMFTVGWRENVVQFSKLIIPSAPVEFCDDDSFRIFCPEPITGLHWLDGTLVIFCASGIYLVTGDGPNDQGIGAFSEPRRLPVNVGCDDARSIVESQDGVYFLGGGLIWLLPRGFGAPIPVGEDVFTFTDSGERCLSAARCTNADDDCMHFTMAASDVAGADTYALVLDSRTRAWGIDNIAGDIGAAASVGGFYTWLLAQWDAAADIPARQFSTAQTQDLSDNGATTWIESKIEFGDWRPFGPIGWGTMPRVAVHGERQAACIVKLDVAVDGASVGTYAKTLAGSGQFYLEHGLERIKGCAFRFTLYDAESSGMTAGAVFNALAFEGHAAEGSKRLDGAAERFT